MNSRSYRAVVVGSGPNGLAAAIALAQAKWPVEIREAQPTWGGGARSAELTLPGFTHDLCSAVHPLALASPFFETLPLEQNGLEWVHPIHPLAHPLDDGTAVVLHRSTQQTADSIGEDGGRYRELMDPLVGDWESLRRTILAPLRFPQHPLEMLKFARESLRSAEALITSHFRGCRARALLAGLAAHSGLRLEQRPSAGFALVLALGAHAVGWPFARGGSQKISDALVAHLRSLGGNVFLSSPIESLEEISGADAVLCDVTPLQLLGIAWQRLPESFCRSLRRYRYGPGIFKMDWALRSPIPWKALECRRAGTLHLGGAWEEIAAAERAASFGEVPERPFVIFTQPSVFDSSRAPDGQHTAWGYCRVPRASGFDMTERIEAQIERFAPGFRELILARHAVPASELYRHNANLLGGDIFGGAQTLRQLLFRPTRGLYSTPAEGLYLCSSSTPPGGGVHGMCGYFAAQQVLDDFRR